MTELSLEEAKAKMLRAIELGNIKIANEEALSRMVLYDPDFTLVSVKMTEGNLRSKDGSYVNFDWETVSAGCGRILFALYDDGRVEIENQCMGKNFITSVLTKCEDKAVRKRLLKLLPNARLLSEPPPSEESWQVE